MVNSLNDKIRNTIINKYSKEITLLNLEKLNYEEYEKIVSLMYSDYYKLDVFMKFVDNKYIYKDLNINKSKLVEKSMKDEEFLSKLIESSIVFDSLPIISKINVFEELFLLDEYNNLLKISNLNLLDIITYQFNFNINDFKEYYKDYVMKNKSVNKNTFVSIFITNKLNEYEILNFDKYKIFILEFLRIYYKWNIFIKNNFSKDFLEKEDIHYLKLIKENKMDDIFNLLSEDLNFLTTLIENYLFYSTSQKMVSEDIVNEYFYNNVEEEVQRKLKLKRD